MNNTYNIYCDESCHLQQDKQRFMLLGGIWCPESKITDISARILEIKKRNSLDPKFEIKWTKVSESGQQLYEDVVNYFFDDDDLHFRVLVADKTQLDHAKYHQTHDEWYYKMYFYLLNAIVAPDSCYNVYLDIKDTLGSSKIRKLSEVLSNSKLDFDRNIFQRFQAVRSHESTILQLCDLIMGAVSYQARDLSGNKGKETIVELVKRRSGYQLDMSTLYKENKFNIFYWKPGNGENVQ